MKKNNKKYLYIVVIAVLAVGGFFLFQDSGGSDNFTASIAEGKYVKLYKSPNCGCCSIYVTYLKREGFSVDVKNVADTKPIQNEYGVPNGLGSCHTSIFGDYVVEGHIPVEAITKLFREKPDIAGITLPGMPIGSPGMPGKKTELFTIYSFTGSGELAVFMEL